MFEAIIQIVFESFQSVQSISTINNSVTSSHYGRLQSHTKYSVRELSLLSYIILLPVSESSVNFLITEHFILLTLMHFATGCNIYVMWPTYINVL